MITNVADHHTLNLPELWDYERKAYAYGYLKPRYPMPVTAWDTMISHMNNCNEQWDIWYAELIDQTYNDYFALLD